MLSHSAHKDHLDIWNTLLDIDKALVDKNVTVFKDLLSTDFIGAAPTGASFTKDNYIRHHCNNNFGIVGLVEEDISAAVIRLYDNTAVVNRRVHSHFKLPAGNVVEYDVQRIEVLSKTGGQWILVSGQGTQVMPVGQPK